MPRFDSGDGGSCCIDSSDGEVGPLTGSAGSLFKSVGSGGGREDSDPIIGEGGPLSGSAGRSPSIGAGSVGNERDSTGSGSSESGGTPASTAGRPPKPRIASDGG